MKLLVNSKDYIMLLGGLLSPLDGIGLKNSISQSFKKRIASFSIKEVIIALDSTLEGDATALFLKQELEPLSISTSRLAFGLPMGVPRLCRWRHTSTCLFKRAAGSKNL